MVASPFFHRKEKKELKCIGWWFDVDPMIFFSYLRVPAKGLSSFRRTKNIFATKPEMSRDVSAKTSHSLLGCVGSVRFEMVSNLNLQLEMDFFSSSFLFNFLSFIFQTSVSRECPKKDPTCRWNSLWWESWGLFAKNRCLAELPGAKQAQMSSERKKIRSYFQSRHWFPCLARP